MNKKIRKPICVMISVILIIACVFSLTAAAAAEENYAFSEEYKTSPYYEKLQAALKETEDKSVMERTLAVALSQEGYLNYALEGIDIEQARQEGKLWTGVELRMSSTETGNTEYTRWAQRYVMNRDEESQYADYDWCAIFVSWCLYQAGYYSREELKKYYYSYYVDPRIFYDADSWIESYNLDQTNVYYVPKAHHKLDAMNWNTYYHVDVDPYDIPYKPGGLLFFSWDASGKYFDHVAIVVDYDENTHVITYTNGNSDGRVITRQIDLDVEEEFRGQAFAKNADRILGYADYDEIKPLEQKEIVAETPVITWDKSASSGIRIKTNTGSVMASVYMDGEYFGSIIESNMVFHEGLLAIGKSELADLPLGAHKMKLVFDDGETDITLYITDTENGAVDLLGDTDGDGEVTVIDATWIQRYDVKMTELSESALTASDVNIDGEVDVIDATLIQRWAVGLPTVDGIGKPISA